MGSTIQARLDSAAQRDLERLVRVMNSTTSQVVREAIRRMAATYPGKKKTRVIGAGKVDSGIHDLGSNKKHLKDFGR
jgi:predicted transcriptional regulator